MSEMIEATFKVCKKCKWHGSLNGVQQVNCDYFLTTGKHRECPVGYCDKYEPGKGQGNKRNFGNL